MAKMHSLSGISAAGEKVGTRRDEYSGVGRPKDKFLEASSDAWV